MHKCLFIFQLYCFVICPPFVKQRVYLPPLQTSPATACAATMPTMPRRISVPDLVYLSVAPELGVDAVLVPLVLPATPPLLVCTGVVLVTLPLAPVTGLVELVVPVAGLVELVAPVAELLALVVRKVLVPPSVGSDLDNPGPPGSDTLPVGRGAKVEPEGKIGVMDPDCALDGITRIAPNRKRAER